MAHEPDLDDPLDPPAEEEVLDPDLPVSDDGTLNRSSAAVRIVTRWLDDQAYDRLRGVLPQIWEADVAWLLEQVSPSDRKRLVEVLDDKFSPEILTHLHANALAETVATLPPAVLSTALRQLDSDDVVDLFQSLEDEQRTEVLRTVSSDLRSVVEESLSFPEESAGRLMQREVVSLAPHWTIAQALIFLRANRETLPRRYDQIVLVDPRHRVVGVVPLTALVASRPEVKLQKLSLDDFITVPADRDQEEVAYDFRRLALTSAPVVDEDGRLLGMITSDDMLHVIEAEAGEDILALGGVQGGDFYGDTIQTTRTRFTWLFVNLLTAIAASLVIGMFEDTIGQLVALAVLMPIVASMGGNAGTQALTVAVRSLAPKELSTANALRVVGKETTVGLINGVIFALVMGLIAAIWFQNASLGGVIAIAMVSNLVIAGVSGVGIPLLLQRAGVDPAVASSVVLTTVTDIVGFFMFLGLAATLLL